MYCFKCGASLEDNAKYCNSCGNEVVESLNITYDDPKEEAEEILEKIDSLTILKDSSDDKDR